MKRAEIYMVSAILIGSTLVSSCDITSSRNYLGTMAGAEIGGVIGEALGWMSTDRHDGPGKAMMGSIIGTVAGAAIGNSITKDRDDNYDSYSSGGYSDGGYTDDYNAGYQTGGGADYSQNNYTQGNSYTYGGSTQGQGYHIETNNALTINNVMYQDEDGDGKCSRNETLNIIYEVKNTSRRTVNNVELKVEAENNEKCFVLSPSNVINIPAGETIRYKAKAFCKSKPTDKETKFKVSANSATGGNVSSELQIKMDK